MAHQTRKNIKNFNKTRIKKRPRSNRHTLKKGGYFFTNSITGDSSITGDVNALKSGLAEKSGNAGEVLGKSAWQLGKFVKGLGQIATLADPVAYAVAAIWRLFNGRFFVVFGLKGFRQIQEDKGLNEEEKSPMINVTNFDNKVYDSKYKNDMYPNFHENGSYYGIKKGSIYVTPIGVGSVFIFKAFGGGTSKNRESKDSTAKEIYKPTNYYIVIKIDINENNKPTAMHYREIRFDGNNYFIGQFPYKISRMSNTIRIWRQIRVFELNLSAILRDYQEKFIKKKIGGGLKEDLRKRIATIDKEIGNKPGLIIERIKLSSELDKIIQGEKQKQQQQQRQQQPHPQYQQQPHPQ